MSTARSTCTSTFSPSHHEWVPSGTPFELSQHGQRRGTRRTICLAAALAACLIVLLPLRMEPGAAAAGPAQQEPGVSFTSGVDFVHVDVSVTDRQGRFIGDLALEDFEIDEDGRPQKVSTLSLVDLPPAGPGAVRATAQAGRPEPDVRSNGSDSVGRVYVIVLDDLHVNALRSSQAKAVARRFVEEYVGPNDLASVLHTSGRADASQEFTSNRGLLLAAIDKFSGRKLRSSVLERLDVYWRRPDAATNATLAMQRVTDPLEAIRADNARSMLKTLANVGDLLSRAEASRRALLLISEGLDHGLSQAVGQTTSGLTTFTATEAPTVLGELQDTIRASARGNVSIYAVDPRGLAVTGDEMMQVTSFPENPHLGLTPAALENELREAQDSLRIVSEQTGGVATVMTNDLTEALDRIVADNSRYYLLGYRSTETRRDARYRRIEVRVKRPGVRVRARPGYMSGPAKKVDAGLLTAAIEPSAMLRRALNSPLPVTVLPMRVFASPFRGDKEASVAVGIELDARNFRFELKDGVYEDRLEVALVALDGQARFKAGDRHTVDLRLKPDTHRAVQAYGLRVLFRLNLPPGRFQLRAAAHESRSSAVGSVYYDLEVPDFHTLPLSMSGVVLSSTDAAQMPTARPDPALASALPAPPTGARRFHARETVTAFFEVYGRAIAASGADVQTIVRAEDGRVHFKSQTSGAAGTGEPVSRLAVRIPLAELPQGLYTLEVEARHRNTQAPGVTRRLPFEIAAR